MRFWPCLLVLALGCGKEHDQAPPPVAPLEDPPCDPTTPRVCFEGDVVACESNGRLGRRLRACKEGCDHGRCKGSCSDDAVKLIYLVDSSNDFLSFDPRLLPDDPFRLIGKLQCGFGLGSPFSMSVDRSGIAWVAYDNGQLFKVDITNARCEPSGFQPGITGSRTFGMGFSTDAPGRDAEKLYLAANNGTNDLHSIDTVRTLSPRRVGTIAATSTQAPELTGGADARLYGFYPETSGIAFVQEIDRASGAAIGRKWNLGTRSLGDVNAYAFAQYAGVFYVFTSTWDEDGSLTNRVHTVDRATGKYEVAMTGIPFRVTGAGVSTCAPERDAAQP